MANQVTHCPIDASLELFGMLDVKIPVKVVDVSLSKDEQIIVECRLTLEISPQIYQSIIQNAAFHLTPDVRIEEDSMNFAPDLPIEIEVRLADECLPHLLAQGSTAETIANYLLALDQTEPTHNLFLVESWYGLYVKQQTPLPFELEGTGTLKMGYRTTWVKEEPVKKVIPEALSERDVPEGSKPNGDRSMLQVMTSLFTKNGEPIYRWEDDSVFSFPYRGKQGEWRCYADAREEQSLCCFYSICPVQVPPEKRSAAAEFLTRVNYVLTVGNFEMDFSDGEVRMRTSIDVEGDRLSVALFQRLTLANVSMMDRYLPGIRAVLDEDVSPSLAIAAIDD